MAEGTKDLSFFEKIKAFFTGVKGEYSKIIFPNQETIKKQTIATVVVSVVIAVLIFLIDLVMKFLLGFIL